MRDKQIYDLTADDFREHGVWYFPMDDDDWEIVRPCLEECDATVLVRTAFLCANGTRFSGYVYWSLSDHMGSIQPNLFLNDGSSMSFWSGIVEASWDWVEGEARNLVYPITFESEPLLGISPMRGQIDGLYYFDEDRQVQCLLPL